MQRGAPRGIAVGGSEAPKLLSFVECHGLSVTRSKVAAGRQNTEGAPAEPLLHVSLARQLSIV
jgi:hypothetical protein